MMRLHGINCDAFDRYTATKPSWQYEVVAPGFKYNMTDLAISVSRNDFIAAYSKFFAKYISKWTSEDCSYQRANQYFSTRW